MVPEGQAPDSEWAAGEWEEVEAGQEERVPEEQARELVPRAVPVRAEAVCGKPALAVVDPVVVVQVPVADQDQAEAEPAAVPGLDPAEAAQVLVQVGAEDLVEGVVREELAEEGLDRGERERQENG